MLSHISLLSKKVPAPVIGLLHKAKLIIYIILLSAQKHEKKSFHFILLYVIHDAEVKMLSYLCSE